MSKRKRTPVIPPGKPEKFSQMTRNVEAEARAAKQQRSTDCAAAVQAILIQYNCRIDVVEMRVNGQVQRISLNYTPLDAPTTPDAPSKNGQME